MKTRVIFVRHAEAEGNLNRIFHGWTDAKITEKGHKQAEKVAERLKDVEIDLIYSSSLTRTLQTAEYISKTKNLPIVKTDRLKEINGGDWEGEMWDDLPKKWPEQFETWENKPHLHKMPNGESMEEFQIRLRNEIEIIIRNNEGKNICIVTHGTAIRALMCYFYKCTLDTMLNVKWYDNTSVTIIDIDNGDFDIIAEGDISHLDNTLSTIENQAWWKNYIKNLEERQEKQQS